MRFLLLCLVALCGAPTFCQSEEEPRLPDLVARTPTDLAITRERNKYRLRLTNTVANLGSTHLELEGHVDPRTGVTEAFQRLFAEDGTFQTVQVGRFLFHRHRDHNHFHFDDFARYELRRVNPDGSPGAVVASSDKVSFCLTDSVLVDPSLPGAPSVPMHFCTRELQGISIGWADIYDASLAGQAIDISRVRDGEYFLTTTVDPAVRLHELTHDNNSGQVRIRFTKRTRQVTISPTPPPSGSSRRR